jgi:hypothetical protein
MSSDSTKPAQPIKPVIFISYAHLDEPEKPRGDEVAWLSFVMKFLRPAVKSGEFAVWDDRAMPGGMKWNPKIDRELRDCDVFVLLVSANSMASNYIIDKELEIAREREANGEIVIYPLLIEPTPNAGLDSVRDFNLRPRDAKPFQGYPLAERNQHMSDAADEIARIAREIAERKRGTITCEPKIEAPAYAHISGLPETGYERLVGRDAELARLDEAWSDDTTNILSLVAEGGAGKSALVNERLARMRADGYRGADCVLGWSFYSQGSKERATAADAFLDWALAKLDLKVESTSASAKGEAIAEALMARRVLLVLDGVEPLQHGPGPQAGQLKDQGLRALLRRFAAAPPRTDHSLIVLTSRVAVADIRRFKDAAPVIDVEKLSEEAGAELLRDNDVWGIDKELRAASREFGGHPLALTLLASLIKETQNGDARRRDHIHGLLTDPDSPGHDHAQRVMKSYEKEWLAGQPVLLAILHCVGLFDRPASGDCLKALRAAPAIPGLTDALVDLSDEQWRRNVERLREVRLLVPRDPSDPEALDAHPLVREWFGERLKQTNEAAWKKAQPPLRPSARHDPRRPNANARRSCAALPRYRPRLPRRTASGGAGGSLQEPYLSLVAGRKTRILRGQQTGCDRWQSRSSFLVLRPALRHPRPCAHSARSRICPRRGRLWVTCTGATARGAARQANRAANGGGGAELAECGYVRLVAWSDGAAIRRPRRRCGEGRTVSHARGSSQRHISDDRQPRNLGRLAPRRRGVAEGRGTVRRRGASATGMATRGPVAVFAAGIPILRSIAVTGASRRGARSCDPDDHH